MLKVLLPTNCSQISTETPSLLVIMSYSGWNGRNGRRMEKGKRFQESVTVTIQFINLHPSEYNAASDSATWILYCYTHENIGAFISQDNDI